jgi:3-(3-hydroxy-phenyl)propionate hydroxylase
MTPKSKASHVFRRAVLDLAGKHSFARPLANSGRLSVPCVYDAFPHFAEDALAGGPAVTRPGSACTDAPLGDGYLLDHLTGDFTLMVLGDLAVTPVAAQGVSPQVLHIGAPSELLAQRYLGEAESAVYLIRPDQHVVGRWPGFDDVAIEAALANALGY